MIYTVERQNVFDGFEEHLYKANLTVRILKDYYTFSNKAFCENDFLQLNIIVVNNILQDIITKSGFKKIDFPDETIYKSERGLNLNYLYLTNNLVAILSSGEVQPARYVVWLEGYLRI